MTKRQRPDPKVAALVEQGVLNPRAENVSDALFLERDFFDARDLVQVKYEMVRRVDADGQSVTKAAAAFGFSRPSFYKARAALQADGLAGLVPRKRGPRGAHKLNEEVMLFLVQARSEDRSLDAPALARQVKSRFGVSVHPRSIERALRRRQKGGP